MEVCALPAASAYQPFSRITRGRNGARSPQDTDGIAPVRGCLPCGQARAKVLYGEGRRLPAPVEEQELQDRANNDADSAKTKALTVRARSCGKLVSGRRATPPPDSQSARSSS